MLATGRAAVLLGSRRLILVPKVQAESLYVYADIGRTRRVPIDKSLLAHEGVNAAVVELDEDERRLAVRFSALVDDGEAETLAVALRRGMGLLSDDVGAGGIARGEGVPITTTLDLLHAWSVGRAADDVKDALIGLRLRANYAPPRNHPLRDWFIAQTAPLSSGGPISGLAEGTTVSTTPVGVDITAKRFG